MADTVLESLKGINAYPIPRRTLLRIIEYRNLWINDDANADLMRSKEYQLAKADLLIWLAGAPNVTQGGQSFTFTDEQRNGFRRQAREIYEQSEPESNIGCVTFGYKGDRL